MLKRHLLILIAAFALFSTSGCSLFKSDSEEPTEEAVAEDTATDEEVSDSTEEVADSSDEEEVVDEYPDDDYGGDESAVATTTVDSAEGVTDEAAALPDQPVEGTTDDTLLVGADESATSPTMDAPVEEPMDPAPVQDTAATSSIPDSYVPETTYVSVKKMKKTPYNNGGALINRLYIARDGDTMASIAEKTMGDSTRSNDLLKWNSHFRGKDLKVGDKVYYASVKNPTDSSQILLYYEEAGIQPEFYTGKSGDSLRKVSKNLLGHERSWMEIYATNDSIPEEDKWSLAEGTQVKYWPAGSAAAPMQQQAEAAPTPTEEMPAAPEAGDTQAVAQNDGSASEAPADTMGEAPTEALPEEPAMDDGGAGSAATVAQNEEPPAPPPEASAPPPAAQIEPPPPPADEASAGGIAGLMGSGEDDSMMMAVLGGLLIVAALIMIVFIRRGRKKVNYG